MLKTLRLSTVGRLSLALAIFLALLAAAALMAARSGPRGSPARASAPGRGTALAQGTNLPPGQQQQGQQQLTDTPRGIVVFGDGEATGSPDVAFVNLGVQTEAKTAHEAIDQNSAAMAAVLVALRQAGVAENRLHTADVSLLPVRAPQKPVDQSPPQVIGYRAANTVSVTVENIDRVGDILDGAIAAGANVAGGVRFALRDDSALRHQALDQAAKSARMKAEALAGSFGLRLGGVQSVTEDNVGRVPLGRADFAQLGAAGGEAPPVQPGELTVRVRLRAVFAYS